MAQQEVKIPTAKLYEHHVQGLTLSDWARRRSLEIQRISPYCNRLTCGLPVSSHSMSRSL